MRVKFIECVDVETNIWKISFGKYHGEMVRLGTRQVRLSPGDGYNYTCPGCGRFMRARGQLCRDCIGDALDGKIRLTWARVEVQRRATCRIAQKEKRLVQTENQKTIPGLRYCERGWRLNIFGRVAE